MECYPGEFDNLLAEALQVQQRASLQTRLVTRAILLMGKTHKGLDLSNAEQEIIYDIIYDKATPIVIEKFNALCEWYNIG